MGWGIPASILLHVVFAAALFLHLPLDFSEPQKEESVQVELVPPPEEEKPEETKPEEPPAPEPPPESEKQEAPPPPPPPPPQEEEKQEPTPPPPPPPEQQQTENQEEEQQAKGQPLPVLRPVFEFGEENTGPRKSETGDSSTEAGTPPEPPPEEPKPEAETTPEPSEATAEEKAAEESPANPVPDDINVPEIDLAENSPQPNDAAAAEESDQPVTDIVRVPLPSPKPAEIKPKETAKPEEPVELAEAKTLFSQNVTDDPVARTAMNGLPRGIRASELCTTELREQLRRSSPPYRPELLPSYRLPSGTVLEVRSGAFRADAQWYNLSFRCEIDENATKVLSFAFNVGEPVPRGEWRRRGFPDF